MFWINLIKIFKKIDNYVKINDEIMWFVEFDDGMDVKIYKFYCAFFRYEIFYCIVCFNLFFLFRIRRVVSVFFFILKCYKIVLCVLIFFFLFRFCKIV